MKIYSEYQISEIIKQRISISEGTSADIHFTYINRGFDVAMASMKNILFGIGFSNARSVLKDIDSSHYSNFHSLYITFLAEVGIIGFILVIMIHFIPVFFAKEYIPIILTLGFFNIFYQLTAEPIFWIILILSWCNFTSWKRGVDKIPVII